MTALIPVALSVRQRLGLSVLLIGHLIAVVAPPVSFQTRGPLGQSPSVATLLAPVEGYGQFLYIDRGYAFFAPDPGPSHLIQAAITAGDGARQELTFPDHRQHWPRLLYHRHFMLAEFLEEIYQPPGPPPQLWEADRPAAEYWAGARSRYERVRDSVIRHLETEHPGHQVVMRRLEHRIPEFLEYQREAIPLDDPRWYRVLLDQPLSELPPTQSASTVPPSATATPDTAPEPVPPPTAATTEH